MRRAASSAATYAGYKKLIASGFLKPEERVVLFNTGSGLLTPELVRGAIEHEYYERTLRGNFMDPQQLLARIGLGGAKMLPGFPQLMRPCDIEGQLVYHLTTFFEKGGMVTVFAFDQPVDLEDGSGWWNNVYWQVLRSRDGKPLVLERWSTPTSPTTPSAGNGPPAAARTPRPISASSTRCCRARSSIRLAIMCAAGSPNSPSSRRNGFIGRGRRLWKHSVQPASRSARPIPSRSLTTTLPASGRLKPTRPPTRKLQHDFSP